MQTPEIVFIDQSLKQELGRCPHYLVDDRSEDCNISDPSKDFYKCFGWYYEGAGFLLNSWLFQIELSTDDLCINLLNKTIVLTFVRFNWYGLLIIILKSIKYPIFV